ncbi:MAG: hypothetical protein K6A44_01360 [bacterium]|nr:hypothetical protein [bacterium]
MLHNKNTGWAYTITALTIIATFAFASLHKANNPVKNVAASFDETVVNIPTKTQSVSPKTKPFIAKYQMQDLDSNLAAYLKHKGYEDMAGGKTLVIYATLVDFYCPYNLQFQKDILSYKNSPAWTNKFTFVERHVYQGELNIPDVHTVEEAMEHNAFVDNCETKAICVIDFKNGKMLSMEANKLGNSQELYDVLSSCYQ